MHSRWKTKNATWTVMSILCYAFLLKVAPFLDTNGKKEPKTICLMSFVHIDEMMHVALAGLACIGLFIKNAIFNTIETRGFRWFATGLPLQRAIFFAIVSSLCNKIQIQCNVSNFYVCLFGKINHFLWLRLKFLLFSVMQWSHHSLQKEANKFRVSFFFLFKCRNYENLTWV